MMHRAWSSIVEVPYCFSRSSVKFQGHTALKIVEFDPNWVFPDSNSSLNSLMAMKCCTKLETAKERCPIVFQYHPSNFKVARDKTSPNLTQIGRFRTIGRSQLSNPSDLPCLSSYGIFYVRNEMTVPHQWCGTIISFLTQNMPQTGPHGHSIHDNWSRELTQCGEVPSRAVMTRWCQAQLRIILGMPSAIERPSYNVTLSLIGWAHTQTDPCQLCQLVHWGHVRYIT